MLIRSKKAKLTIRSGPFLGKSEPRTIETVRLCLYEMNRVEEIELCGIPGLILKEIFREPKSAPQLHTLSISRTAFSIDEDFLYDTGRLRRVELINCEISWDSQLLTGLTRLTLKNSLKAKSSIIQVLNALRRMPALTHLYLNRSIPDDLEGPSTYAVVDLPCLRVLTIVSGVGALATFLRHISFPHSTISNLICKDNHSTEDDFSKNFSVLATKFLSNLVIRGLRLEYSDYSDDEFHLWTTSPIQECQCLQSPPNSQSGIHLVLPWYSFETLNYAFDAMSLSFLTQLQLSISKAIDFQTWVEIFGRLPFLERVCLQRSAPRPFFEALVYKTKAGEKSKAVYHDVSFPKLRYIHLVGIDFGYRSSISVDTLLDCLMERYKRNAEVQVFRLEDSYYISPDDVERLKKVVQVVDVIWEGKEIKDW